MHNPDEYGNDRDTNARNRGLTFFWCLKELEIIIIMTGTIVQIYEIQTPDEAQAVIEMGVAHIGSVITSLQDRYDLVIRETIERVREQGAISCLIPLYTEPSAVFDTLAYQRPHIVHFCDTLDPHGGQPVENAIELQSQVKSSFSDIRIMRAIPIGRKAGTQRDAILALASRLEPVTDFFLTDTLIADEAKAADSDQPVNGFVGITGLTCDWSVAAALVDQSNIPVILAGGISPENVADGIEKVGPYGVDSCTCTNAVDEDGKPIRFKKDLLRVEALVSAVHRASDSLQRQSSG